MSAERKDSGDSSSTVEQPIAGQGKQDHKPCFRRATSSTAALESAMGRLVFGSAVPEDMPTLVSNAGACIMMWLSGTSRNSFLP